MKSVPSVPRYLGTYVQLFIDGETISEEGAMQRDPLAMAMLASSPGSCAGEEEKEPGTHCSRMRRVPLVTCILLRYTKITVNFCLPPERPYCRVILPVRHLRAVLKSETISL